MKDGKPDAEQQQKTDELQKAVSDARARQEEIIKAYAKDMPQVNQLIDLALLGNGLLKGKDLSNFIDRSLSLIK